MRIIAGEYKGRVLQTVQSSKTRPTTDRVREAWASTLINTLPGGDLEGARVLDPFAGSGALGLELLSRGAEECLFIEQNRAAAAMLKNNLASLNLREPTARVCVADSLSPQLLSCVRKNAAFTVIALDPPYAVPACRVENLLATLAQAGLLADQCVVSYEHAADNSAKGERMLLQNVGSLRALQLVKQKIYGTICLDYYLCQ